MAQQRVTKPKSWEKEQKEVEAAKQASVEKEDIKGKTDDLMDEIDSLLEEQDVLVNYRQKGGE